MVLLFLTVDWPTVGSYRSKENTLFSGGDRSYRCIGKENTLVSGACISPPCLRIRFWRKVNVGGSCSTSTRRGRCCFLTRETPLCIQLHEHRDRVEGSLSCESFELKKRKGLRRTNPLPKTMLLMYESTSNSRKYLKDDFLRASVVAVVVTEMTAKVLGVTYLPGFLGRCRCRRPENVTC